jgi:phage protein D
MVEKAIQPEVYLFWNHKNIYNELSPDLSGVTYTDNEAGKADDLSLYLSNITGDFFNSWYPEKGDTLRLLIGYNDREAKLDTGIFQIDNINFSGPPDQVDIRALSTGITRSLRTGNNKTFENQTLKQVAGYFCNKNGWQLIDGDSKLNNVLISRKTQANKTDLSFLSELAKEYGFIFSIKGDKMVFMEHSTLDRIPGVIGIGRYDLERYSLTNKTHGTYAAATVKATDRKTGKVIQSTVEGDSDSADILNQSGGAVTSPSQASAYASSGLGESNRKQQTGNLSMPGNPLLVAGINFDLEGFGKASGKYHITKSTHTVSPGGYTTSIDIERIGDTGDLKPSAKRTAYETETEKYNKKLPVIEYEFDKWGQLHMKVDNGKVF